MIDLKEPVRPSYTKEEEQLLREKFLLLLHSLLLVYLALHNLLVPLVNNLFKGHGVLTDVHFWFLAQLPLHYMLRSKRQIPDLFIIFLLTGSLARLLYEVTHLTSFKSWTFFSVVISEFSTFLFLFVLWSYVKFRSGPGRILASVLVGLAVPVGLAVMEPRSVKVPLPKYLTTTTPVASDLGALGCKGSVVELNFPLRRPVRPSTGLALSSCGTEESLVTFEGAMKVTNRLPYNVNVRLYKLDPKGRRVRWKFVRLVQVAPGKTWNLGPLLSSETIYLLKSPERRALGHTILLPAGLKTMLLGEGTLRFDYDTVKWTQKE